MSFAAKQIRFQRKRSKGYNKAITAITSVVLVGGLITGIALGVASIKPNSKVPDDFDKMREAYKNYLIKTSSLANYGDLSADEIMNKIVIGTDSKTKEKIYSTLISNMLELPVICIKHLKYVQLLIRWIFIREYGLVNMIIYCGT